MNGIRVSVSIPITHSRNVSRGVISHRSGIEEERSLNIGVDFEGYAEPIGWVVTRGHTWVICHPG